MHTKTRVVGVSALIATFIIGFSLVGGALAQTVTTSSSAITGVAISARPSCPPGLVKNLARGSRGAGVMTLQQTLASIGYFNTTATGYFGPVTFGAVVSFQKANGVPATGYFGPLSYAAMTKRCTSAPPNPAPTPAPTVSFSADPTSGNAPLDVSFVGTGVTGGSQYIIEYGDGSHSDPLAAIDVCMHLSDGSGGCPKVQSSHTYEKDGTYTATIEAYIACMWSNPRCLIATVPLGSVTVIVGSVSGTPVISSISPASGPIGASVTLQGNGFAPNMIVRFAEGSVTHSTSADGRSITFSVPTGIGPYCAPGMMCAMYIRQLAAGDYKVFVQNADGSTVSNSVVFTVTGGQGSGNLSITGLDAPATLAMGTTGTWTVHVNSPSTNANLHYSVVWGDEAQTGSAIMAPAPSTVQTSATFTHAYKGSGTYKPVFTITDDAGHSVSSSATVTVTPWY